MSTVHGGEADAEGLGWVISRTESSPWQSVPRVTAPFRHTYRHRMFVSFKAFTWQAGDSARGQASFRYSCVILPERTESIWPNNSTDTLELDRMYSLCALYFFQHLKI